MWGNHLADRSCAADYRDFSAAGNRRFSTYTVDQVLELYTHTDTLYCANLKGEQTLRCFDAIFEENVDDRKRTLHNFSINKYQLK